MTDQQERSPRRFYIRNHLYSIFEEMASEIGCSVDYLVNEAMRSYARKHHTAKSLEEGDPPPSSSGPPPIPTPPPRELQTSPSDRPLYLWFNQQRYMINTARFIIGRGGQNKHCDLIIPDSNISRNHCAITYHNNDYYIRDLNSTNGVEFNGDKVRQKRIFEGETFYLCDYPLIFTFQAQRVF